MLLRSFAKPTRVRDENEIMKDERPLKKPRVPTKSGLSTSTTAVKRPVLSDVSNKKPTTLIATKSFNQPTKTETTKRAALADVKNTTAKATTAFPTKTTLATAGGRVIMKAKRKAPILQKPVAKQQPITKQPEQIVRIIEEKKAEPEEKEPEEEEEEEEEEQMPEVPTSSRMEIEDVSVSVNPALAASCEDMSTDENADVSTDDVDKRNRSLSELVEPMETLSCGPASSGQGSESIEAIFAAEDDVVEDIDYEDLHDEAQCVEYVNEIIELWREKERGTRMPKPRYMKCQRELNHKMRAIMIDWMMDVGVQFTLTAETLFLAVQLVDRLLSIKEVSKGKIQLIGMASLVIASKFEETRVPCLDDFLWISADAYTREELLRVEKIMLGALDWDLTLPTPLHFLRRFSKASRSDSVTHTLSKYLIELSLAEYKMLRFPPSMIAASAVYLARKMMKKTPVWTKTLQHYTQYNEDALKECVALLNEVHGSPSDPKFFKAVVKKYANPALFAVSNLPAITLEW